MDTPETDRPAGFAPGAVSARSCDTGAGLCGRASLPAGGVACDAFSLAAGAGAEVGRAGGVAGAGVAGRFVPGTSCRTVRSASGAA